MDEEDDGFFHYDDRFPPMCIRPPEHQLPEYKESMEGALTQYLQESYKDGPKHEDSVLPNGLTAGEAGVLYFRELNQKRRRTDRPPVDAHELVDCVARALHKHMGINLQNPRCQEIFTRHIDASLFQTKQFQRRLTPAIKSFLTEIRMKTKGYTAKLKHVILEVNALVAQSAAEEVSTKSS